VAKILGLAGKPQGVDGSRVEEMIIAGEIDEVARYCESDVLNTYRVWLVYELFRGAITQEQLDWSEAQIRSFVASRKSVNPHVCAANSGKPCISLGSECLGSRFPKFRP
jgi:3'-5' exonuclease